MKETKYNQPNRETDIDIAKGIGIILVIIGHWISNDDVVKIIYAVHMPLFFILSGIVMKEKKQFTLKELIYNERKLIVSYVFWTIIFMMYDFIMRAIIQGEGLSRIIKDIFYIISMWGNSVLWFLVTLVFAKVVTYIWITVCKSKIIQIGVMLTIFIISSYIVVYIDLWRDSKSFYTLLYYVIGSILRVFQASFFLNVGICLKSVVKYIRKMNKGATLAIGTLLLVAIIFISSCADKRVDMHYMLWGDNVFLSLIVAIAGAIGILLVCQNLKQLKMTQKILTWFGINSLFLMTIHSYFDIYEFVKDLLEMSVQSINMTLINTVSIILAFCIVVVLTKIFSRFVNNTINIIICKIKI